MTEYPADFSGTLDGYYSGFPCDRVATATTTTTTNDFGWNPPYVPPSTLHKVIPMGQPELPTPASTISDVTFRESPSDQYLPLQYFSFPLRNQVAWPSLEKITHLNAEVADREYWERYWGFPARNHSCWRPLGHGPRVGGAFVKPNNFGRKAIEFLAPADETGKACDSIHSKTCYCDSSCTRRGNCCLKCAKGVQMAGCEWQKFIHDILPTCRNMSMFEVYAERTAQTLLDGRPEGKPLPEKVRRESYSRILHNCPRGRGHLLSSTRGVYLKLIPKCW